MPSIEYLRSFRIFGYAIFDFALSLVGVYILSPILSWLFLKIGIKISRKSWLLLTIPASIVIHFMVGSITPLTEQFINPNGDFVAKIIVVILTYMGLKNITILRK